MESVCILACKSYVDWREPVDIMHTRIPGIGAVRGRNNWSSEGSFSSADCVVQEVLHLNSSWAGI